MAANSDVVPAVPYEQLHRIAVNLSKAGVNPSPVMILAVRDLQYQLATDFDTPSKLQIEMAAARMGITYEQMRAAL